MKKPTLTILGAGGHAKVVLSTALAQGIKVQGFLDDNISLHEKTIMHYPIVGRTSALLTHEVDEAVFGLGSNSKRKEIVERYTDFNRWKSLIHPSAVLDASVRIGMGTVVFAGAVIQPDVIIGKHSIINTGATIDHDCIIGDYVHIAPGVHIAGGVRIEDGVFIGIGSAVIPNRQIGAWTTVAAGGIVIHDIAANKLVMGVPAKERIVYVD